MGSHRSGTLGWALTCAVIAAAGLASTAKAAPPAIVQMSEDGPVLATPGGMTLYTTAMDDPTPGKAHCNDVRAKTERTVEGYMPVPMAETRPTCAQKSPPFLAAAGAAADGPWKPIPRDGGGRQWAYEGHPLYTSIRDHRPGDVNGVGLGRGSYLWKPAFAPLGFPPGLKIVRRPEGLVLAGADSRPLYVRRGLQRVSDGPAPSLEPVRAAAVARAQGDWTVMDAGAGRRQYAFRGQPLYAVAAGAAEADLNGQWALAIYRPAVGRPADIGTRLSLIGEVYTTRDGMALYAFECQVNGATCGDPGDPAAHWSLLCGGPAECMERWRPYRASPGARPVGEWTIIDVAQPLFADATGPTYRPQDAPAKVRAWAYRGRPVFTFVDDELPGQLLGHLTGKGPSFVALVIAGTQPES